MINRAEILAAIAGIVLGGGRELSAGGIHIRYPVDAPEKLAAANEVYAQGVLNMYERHPRWFEHTHPFYTEMFHNPEMMDRLIARWEAHEQRFEYWHYCLWKVLDGYMISHQTPLPLLPILPPSSSHAVSEAGGNGPGGGPGKGNQNLGAPGVPEPSAGVLMVSGLIVGLIRFARRRVSGRSSTGEPVPPS
jgi:hypothetical protein